MKGDENYQKSQKCVHKRKVEEVGLVQSREVRADGQCPGLRTVYGMKILLQKRTGVHTVRDHHRLYKKTNIQMKRCSLRKLSTAKCR